MTSSDRRFRVGLLGHGTVGSAFASLCAQAATGPWDRERLEQVVINLLSNALRYGARTPIEVSVAAAADAAILTVADQGEGIAPELQTRIFDKFERGVSSRHYGGLGLGLYITRSIVEAHGGTIAVQSALGEGARFTVWLPRS